MKKHVIHTDDHPWQPKLVPQIANEQKGWFKKLSDLHGLEQFEVRLTRIPPGETNTWHHTHTVIEEWFYVLRGKCHLYLNGAWTEIGTGDSVATAPGDYHTFRNLGTEDCDMIMVGINHPDDQAHRIEEPTLPSGA
jgi:uncharacterized cupin superfamily protein